MIASMHDACDLQIITTVLHSRDKENKKKRKSYTILYIIFFDIKRIYRPNIYLVNRPRDVNIYVII